jgi:hypothetical protein
MRPVNFAATVLWFMLIPGVAGCLHGRPAPAPEPREIPVVVDKPVAVSCVPPNVGDAPAYSDNAKALRAAQDGAERYRLTILGRAERDARLSVVEPVIDGCRKAADK